MDEFQDANMAQILLLELVGRGPDKPDNVVVVGDDDQSIYRFRGASYAAFEQFGERFEQAPVWAPDRADGRRSLSQPLLENRRSTGHILSAASRLIGHNQKRLKNGPLAPDQGRRASRSTSSTPRTSRTRRTSSWRWIKDDVRGAAVSRERWSDIAVLYRKHRHRDLIVERLRKQDIPYVVVGGTGLFAVPEVRDVEAALRVAANPDDSTAFVRLLSAGPWRLDAAEILRAHQRRRVGRTAHLPGRGWTSCARARSRSPSRPARRCRDSGARIWRRSPRRRSGRRRTSTTAEPETVRQRRSREQRAQWRREQLDARLRVKLERLMALLNELVPRAPARRAVRGARGLPRPHEHAPRPDRRRNAGRAANGAGARAADALRRRLAAVAPARQPRPSSSPTWTSTSRSAATSTPTQVGRVEVEGVQLMTVYQAKGLEYEAVVVPRLVEGQFPDTREEQTAASRSSCSSRSRRPISRSTRSAACCSWP